MRKVAYTNPCLNELVYSVLRSARKDEIYKLKGRFLKASRTDVAAKMFSAKSTLEEKLALLSEFGIRFFTVFADVERVTLKEVEAILEKFKAERNADALKDVAGLGMHVTSDKEYVHLLGLMANTTNHPSYLLNLEFNRVGYHAKKWTASSKNKHDAPTEEVMESANYLAKIIFASHFALYKAPITHGIAPADVAVLMYLYVNRQSFISREGIAGKFAGDISKRQIVRSIKGLHFNMYIEKHAYASPDKFTITSLGIKVVNSYMDKVFKNIEF